MKFWVGFLLTSAVLAGDRVQRTFGLFNTRADQYEFVPYTREQRIQVAQTVLNLMRIYVNRQSKIHHYGFDPLPKAQDMVKIAGSLSDTDFHHEMLRIFTPLRDMHTLYRLPGPQGCLDNVKAVSFSIADEGVNEKIVAHRFSEFTEVRNLSPGIKDISLGDKLVSIDNELIQDYIQRRMAVSGGANPFGGKRRVLQRMSLILGAIELPPTQQDTVYVFERFQDSSRYTVTLPWVTHSREDCYPGAKAVLDKIKSGTPIDKLDIITTSQDTFNQGNEEPDLPDLRTRLRQTAFAMFSLNNKFIRYGDALEYMIYEPKTKNLGVIALKSFDPANGNFKQLLGKLFELVTIHLASTRAILFDIRGNGGGLMNLADTIPQFFKKDIEPILLRLINDPFNLNRKILNARNYPRKDWTISFNTSPSTNPFSNPMSFTPKGAANILREPISKKPVAILNDGTCYSSCEIFSALFQDNSVGHVFSEDGSTDGGGSSSVSMEHFFPAYSPADFPYLPYSMTLPKRARPNITIGWRQIVRIVQNKEKKKEYQLLEDIGVIPKKMIRPKQADFLQGVTTYSVYDTIADILAVDPRPT